MQFQIQQQNQEKIDEHKLSQHIVSKEVANKKLADKITIVTNEKDSEITKLKDELTRQQEEVKSVNDTKLEHGEKQNRLEKDLTRLKIENRQATTKKQMQEEANKQLEIQLNML